MRGGRSNFSGECGNIFCCVKLTIELLDRGGGNRGRYGNFNDDQGREDSYSGGGRPAYGHQNSRDGGNYGNREGRFNNYDGNRGGNRSGGAGYEPERRTSESMSSLSLEGK